MTEAPAKTWLAAQVGVATAPLAYVHEAYLVKSAVESDVQAMQRPVSKTYPVAQAVHLVASVLRISVQPVYGFYSHFFLLSQGMNPVLQTIALTTKVVDAQVQDSTLVISTPLAGVVAVVHEVVQ